MNSKFRCILTFDFEAMTNPWSAPLVFSHQLINIYLDTEAGGRTDTYKRGAGVKFRQKEILSSYDRGKEQYPVLTFPGRPK